MQEVLSVEHASGKGSTDENFPVGSLLIAKRYRPHVMAYYRFARNADDVADAPDLSSEEKITRLNRMAAVLDGATGDDAPSAVQLRLSLAQTGVSKTHCHELLDAFRQDAVKSRYANWRELMDYCRLSAAPVGRYLLDLHGESKDTWLASDALCAALQVINHLQDCAKDFSDLDRVYLPQDWLTQKGGSTADLNGAASSAGLRHCLDLCVEATRPLVQSAFTLAGGVKDWGLRMESAVITGLAHRLLLKLSSQDPLAQRVKLGKSEILWSALVSMAMPRFGATR